MTSSERLLKGQKSDKPVYLITTKEELIIERDFMESNWQDSMFQRMQELSKQCYLLFGTPLSNI